MQIRIDNDADPYIIHPKHKLKVRKFLSEMEDEG